MLPTPVVAASFLSKCSGLSLPGSARPGKSQEIIVSAGDSVEWGFELKLNRRQCEQP
jgi:hypothetical protein